MRFGYNVYVSHVDPDDPAYFGLIGARATLAGAQALAERVLGRKIYGFFRAGAPGSKDLATNGSLEKIREDGPRHARLLHDWMHEGKAPWSGKPLARGNRRG